MYKTAPDPRAAPTERRALARARACSVARSSDLISRTGRHTQARGDYGDALPLEKSGTGPISPSSQS